MDHLTALLEAYGLRKDWACVTKRWFTWTFGPMLVFNHMNAWPYGHVTSWSIGVMWSKWCMIKLDGKVVDVLLEHDDIVLISKNSYPETIYCVVLS